MSSKQLIIVLGVVSCVMLSGVSQSRAASTAQYDRGTYAPLGRAPNVEQRGVIYYPDDLSTSEGSYPLVLILHGRHSWCYNPSNGSLNNSWPCPSGYQPIPSYLGYEYLGEALADRGYIVVSIAANGIDSLDSVTIDCFHTQGCDLRVDPNCQCNDPQTDPTCVYDGCIVERADLIEQHLNLLNTFNTVGSSSYPEPFASQLIGKIDLRNIGMMGHSRGGDGVVNHYANYAASSPFRVKAILALAPTENMDTAVDNVPLSIMVGYCDGDLEQLDGLRFFDSSRYNTAVDQASLYTVLNMGANHNYFNTMWTPECWQNQATDLCWQDDIGTMPQGTRDDWQSEDSTLSDAHCGSSGPRLTPTAQRSLALEYGVSFFEYYIRKQAGYASFLRGDTPPVGTDFSSNTFMAYQPPGYRRLDLNRLTEPDRLDSTTLMNEALDRGDVTDVFLAPYELCTDCNLLRANKPTGNPPHEGLSRLQIGWSGSAGTYTNDLPEGTRNISGFDTLQFRASVDYQGSTTASPVEFTVSLSDGTNLFSVSTDQQSGNNVLFIPPGDTLSKTSVMNTVRLPLSLFGNASVLQDVHSVVFSFDQDQPGTILISDIAFTNETKPTPSDVVLVLDRSGSMASQDFADEGNNDTRLTIAKKGAEFFLNALDPVDSHRVGLVSYNQAAATLSSLVAPTDSALTTAIDSYITNGASGTTSIGAGLNAALTELETNGDSSRAPAIMLLTDGRQNTAPCLEIDGVSGPTWGHCPPGSQPTLRRDDPRIASIPICSLGMARSQGEVDERILENFSSQYLDAQPNDQQLATSMASFTKCASVVNGMDIAVDPNGILDTGMVAAPAYTYNSAGDAKLTFLSSWSTSVDKLGDMRLLVNKPNGDLLLPSDPTDKSLTPDWNIQRNRLPDVGEWRFQVMRDNTRIVNGFTSNSFDDYDKGVTLIRRQIQRMCPDGCDNVLYFEDGRVGTGPSVYEGALNAELAAGLINSVDSYDESSAEAFETALNSYTPLYQLLIYIHQLPGVATEPYDDEIGYRLCTENVDRRAIITDTRAPQVDEGELPVSFHICSGAYPGGMDTINYSTLQNIDNTMLEENLSLSDPGYGVFSYSVGAIPQQYSYMSVIGAAQLEGGNEYAASITIPGNIPMELGSMVTMSKDIVFYPGVDCPPETTCDPPPPQQRTRSLQRWASEVHFAGFAPIDSVEIPAELNEGITLSVKTDEFSPPGGILSSSVWAEVTRPLIGLDSALFDYGCPGELNPNGDIIFGSGISISPDAIPTETESYWLNDLGVDGDLSAADQVWTLFVPELGTVTGTYAIHYYAEFTYREASGLIRTMHREAVSTRYVGEEVLGGSTPCPTTGICDPDVIPPIIGAVESATVTKCDIYDGIITLTVPEAADQCVSPVSVTGEVIASDAGAVGTPVAADGTVVLPLGTHTIRWTADDGTNQAYSDQIVTVLPGLFAKQQLRLEDRATVGSALSAGNMLTSIGNNVTTSDIQSIRGVLAGRDLTVEGSIKSSGNIRLGSNPNISDGIYPYTSLNLPDFPTLTGIVFPPASGDLNVYVNSSETLPLAPGSYHNVFVNSGGTLALAPGVYYFEGLVLNSATSVTVSPSGPVQIYVQNQLAVRSAFTDEDDNPVAVSIGYLGTNSVVLEAPFLGTVIAPNATMELGTGSARYFGGVYMANTLIVRPDITVECISFESTDPNNDVPDCDDGEQNQDETDVDCGGVCGSTCEVGELCAINDDCISDYCASGVCQNPPSGCTESVAVDMGADGNTITVPNNGCIMVRNAYPSWWGIRTMMLQNTSPGTYPVPFTWQNNCAASSGMGSFTGDWQNKYLTLTNSACATLIDLQGAGNGTISIRYYGG